MKIDIPKPKIKIYGVVRDKDGKIKYDDFDALDPELQKIILEEEGKDGRNFRDNC